MNFTSELKNKTNVIYISKQVCPLQHGDDADICNQTEVLASAPEMNGSHHSLRQICALLKQARGWKGDFMISLSVRPNNVLEW